MDGSSTEESEGEIPSTKPQNTITVRDNRTGTSYVIPIENGAINAQEFARIKSQEKGKGLRIYDPGFVNTALASSSICYVDGQRGVLLYRGYPIEVLAEKCTFLEVSYLLIFGQLPTKIQNDQWVSKVMRHTFIHENMVSMLQTFRYDAHPMGIIISSIAAMSTFHPEANPAIHGAKLFQNKDVRSKQIYRILGKMPTIAACAYRHRIGRPYNTPVNHLGYCENFMYMLDRLSEKDYRPNPVLCRALEILFIVHAEHEMSCSTATVRHVSSASPDPYCVISAAASALYGPIHGSANEAVLTMLEEIGSVDNIPIFIQQVKQKKKKLMGFGHRIYRSYDPRAKILKKTLEQVAQVVGKDDPLVAVAKSLEAAALNDDYFKTRKLYPNIDFYSGLIYRMMGKQFLLLVTRIRNVYCYVWNSLQMCQHAFVDFGFVIHLDRVIDQLFFSCRLSDRYVSSIVYYSFDGGLVGTLVSEINVNPASF
eukprot:TRINITY_DN4409_c0_g1_i1.p1 TRINITY_DN4409_c0_g1~~TRINITY_DN4409_c0_g1_i1.p1  ORF type:complete len:481 (-),score=76.59 TRINITY_DN4409_c0_g1_i1:406-1848(-)